LAIEFKYNKSSLHQLSLQLKVRETALPTLKSKEAALRMEVKHAKDMAEDYKQQLEAKQEEISKLKRLWAEFDPDLVRLKDAAYQVRTIAGVKIPVLEEMEFEIGEFSLFHSPNWYMDGIAILKDLTRLSLIRDVHLRCMQLLEYARKKTSQKVNLYEKVQIPGYKQAMNKIKRYLEDEENLSKSAQKILKRRNEEKQAAAEAI